ncbi:Protein-glutamine gamma-glutamyltransferase 2 [Liparis tanakae]|uniref:Protein-glutamine gamma-glutamyltransferase 2 n=1 Tax=Liparis tanakae TaxID=230148 RepID=A0A4Z2GIH1_9TELE|nr:Protein-glutamine gamma-glutamyltransferase 2 [Liparis tanakae]
MSLCLSGKFHCAAPSRCRLKLVNFKTLENQNSHETEGLGSKHLVVRRGKPFNVTLLFHNRSVNPHTESLVLEVCLDDPVYMPLDVQIQEYIKSDYGLVYMGTYQNIIRRPWSFGQYEPGVLEACLKLLEVSPQHLWDKDDDYIRRADPVYLSRVICAMGKWQGSYGGGVNPTEWSGSADILHRWLSSNCSPVRYGQNFHVWVECWMRRADLGAGFDGWQVVDPTPQEKSADQERINTECDSGEEFRNPSRHNRHSPFSPGVFCCGPCPVVAVRRRYIRAPYDASFVYAAVDANVAQLILHEGRVVGRTLDAGWVGRLIYTKSIDSDSPENLTGTYKSKKKGFLEPRTHFSPSPLGGMPPGLEVSLSIDGRPSVGGSISVRVTVTNQSSRPRLLMEHLDAQLKDFNSNPERSFWKAQQEVYILPGEVLTLHQTIPPSAYESILAGDDIVNVAVVIKDERTKERVLAVREFNMSSPQITIEIEGGDDIQMKKEHTAQVCFTNTLAKALTGAVLTVEGSGLLLGKHQAR